VAVGINEKYFDVHLPTNFPNRLQPHHPDPCTPPSLHPLVKAKRNIDLPKMTQREGALLEVQDPPLPNNVATGHPTIELILHGATSLTVVTGLPMVELTQLEATSQPRPDLPTTAPILLAATSPLDMNITVPVLPEVSPSIWKELTRHAVANPLGPNNWIVQTRPRVSKVVPVHILPYLLKSEASLVLLHNQQLPSRLNPTLWPGLVLQQHPLQLQLATSRLNPIS